MLVEVELCIWWEKRKLYCAFMSYWLRTVMKKVSVYITLSEMLPAPILGGLSLPRQSTGFSLL